MAHQQRPLRSVRTDGSARPLNAAAEPVSGDLLRLKDRWRRAHRGWPARSPIVQFPNAPLLVGLTGWVVAELADGSSQAYARAVFYVGISAWAWGELTGGVNWFRRALGAAGLVYVVVEVGAALST